MANQKTNIPASPGPGYSFMKRSPKPSTISTPMFKNADTHSASRGKDGKSK